MRKHWLIVGLVVLALLAAGCGPAADDGNGEEAGGEAAQSYHMVISTGGTSGSYFPMGGDIANVITNYVEGASATAQTSGGSIENLKLIERGESEMGLAQNALADYAFKGIDMFEQKLTKARAIATFYPELVQIDVRADKNVKNIEDIKGLKISVGPPGSGSEANARQFLEILGITYDTFQPQFLSNTDAADQLKDNVIDGMIITSGLPSPAIMDIALLSDVNVIGFTEEQLAAILDKMDFFTPETIPAGTYEGQEEDVVTIAVQAVLFISEDIPEDVVYGITKAIWEHKDELVMAMSKAEHMDPDDPVKGVTVPVHPGALKYYNEIGVSVNK